MGYGCFDRFALCARTDGWPLQALNCLSSFVYLQFAGRTNRDLEGWQHGCSNTVDLLLRNGANVHAKALDGKTALSLAMENRHNDLVQVRQCPAHNAASSRAELNLSSWRNLTNNVKTWIKQGLG